MAQAIGMNAGLWISGVLGGEVCDIRGPGGPKMLHSSPVSATLAPTGGADQKSGPSFAPTGIEVVQRHAGRFVRFA